MGSPPVRSTPVRSTTDAQYADLLGRLAAVPAPQPQRRSLTREQAKAWEFDDLIEINGEATW